MRQIVTPAVLACALALPVHAETSENGSGFSLMEEGARLLFRGLTQEMEPTLRQLDQLPEQLEPALRGFVDQMGPALAEILEKVDDFSMYHAPEILPNGDIILRKKTPKDDAQEDPEAQNLTPKPEIDL